MEKLDKERYLKRVIVVCWIALAICFGIKLFGGNLFEIMCNNENFIKVCEYADNHWWAYYLISVIISFINTYFFILAVMQETKYNKWQLIMVIATVLLTNIIKCINAKLSFITDIWQMIVMPCIFTIKTPKKHWYVLVGNALLMVFQLVSIFVKNVRSVFVTNNGVLISAIFAIDVLLMVILYFAYMNIIKERKK